MNNILGMGIIFGKHQGLGNLGPAREYLRQFFPERPDNRPYLVRCHYTAVKLIGSIF